MSFHNSYTYIPLYTGVGVNVTNKYPTLSLADCINMHNAVLSSSSSSSHQLELISQEHLLAAILNTMEVLLQDLEKTLSTRPLEDSLFCKLYYQYWMHRWVHAVTIAVFINAACPW